MKRLAQSLLVGLFVVVATPLPVKAAQVNVAEVRIDGAHTYTMALTNTRTRPEYSEGDFVVNIDSSMLSVGPHLVEVRMQTSGGVWCKWQPHWIRVGGKVTLTAAEYFFDVDPGPGNGTPIPSPVDGAWNGPDEDIQLVRRSDDLSPGYHTLYVRCKDSDGNWGTTNQTDFYVAEPLHIVAAEWTTDPDCTPGDGNPMYAEDGAFDEAEEELVSCPPVDSSALGEVGERGYIYVRVQDSLGRWSTRRGLSDYIWNGNEPPGAAPGEWVCDPDKAWPPGDEGQSWGWIMLGPPCAAASLGDYDRDCNVDLDDYAVDCVHQGGVPMHGCFGGPGAPHAAHCEVFDFDSDGDVDLQDFAGFQRAFTGAGWPEVILGANDGSTLTLHEGRSFAVRLAANPTTGFVWRVVQLDSTVLEITDHEYRCTDPCPVGGGGMETWTLVARSVGTTPLRLEYRRPWEPDDVEPADSFEITVVVIPAP